jgi:hypothetical protein
MLNDRENILSALREKPLKVPPRADILGRHIKGPSDPIFRGLASRYNKVSTRETRNSARDF